RPRSAWRLAGLVAAAAAVVAIPVFLRPGPRGRGASLGVAAPQHAGGAASEALVAARAAEPPGRVPVALDLAAGRALDAPAEQLGTLSVRVVDRDGAPLRGALVWMMALGLDRDDEPASREAGRTDAAGRLAVALVPADVGDIFGRRTVGVWAGADDRAASRACYAPLADALERELVLATRGPAWELRGRVLGCREPLAGAVVAVGSGGWESDGSVMTWDRPQRLRTDASGRFAVDLPPGRHRVAVTAPGYAPFITHPDSRSGKGELALHLELGASVSGVVRDTDGVPVAGAEVFAGREYDEPSWETRTAADGSFELAGLPAGARYLYARVDDRPQFVRSVMELTPGKNELWDCRLRPEPPLEIRLVDEEQQPLAGHVVHLSADARAPWLRALTTDEDGRATTFGPPPGPWRAVIHRPAQLGHGRADEPHSIVEFAGRETGPTTIRVPAEPECRGTLEATVLTRAGTAPQGANLRLVGGDLWLDRKIPIDAADGHARLEHVPAGSYLLCVGWRDHPTVVLRRCTLAADDALDLGSIALPESATLVLDRALPAGLTLELAQNLDGRREVVARTSNPPPFELPPGSFEVVLRSARGILHREAISLGAGDRVSWSVPDAVRKRD
ncbi:MAG: carboxypeptidase regulatory-like domain-containing protein, partial [Planctomycetota bacterium]